MVHDSSAHMKKASTFSWGFSWGFFCGLGGFTSWSNTINIESSAACKEAVDTFGCLFSSTTWMSMLGNSSQKYHLTVWLCIFRSFLILCSSREGASSRLFIFYYFGSVHLLLLYNAEASIFATVSEPNMRRYADDLKFCRRSIYCHNEQRKLHIWWMEEICAPVDRCYSYGFNHPRWCRISSIHSMIDYSIRKYMMYQYD